MAVAQQRKRKEYGSLTPDFILDHAESLINEQGLESFSFRKLADQCGCGAMSLYQYFENKRLLLSALLDRRVEQHCFHNHPVSDPEAWLEKTFLLIYQELIREIQFIPLFCDPDYTGPASLRLVNGIHHVFLKQAGLDTKGSARAMYVLLSFINGAALQHAANHKRKPVLSKEQKPFLDYFVSQLDWENELSSVLATVQEYDQYIGGQHIKNELQMLICTVINPSN